MKGNRELERMCADFARVGEALEKGELTNMIVFAEVEGKGPPIVFIHGQPNVGNFARLIGFVEHIKTSLLGAMTQAMTRPNAAMTSGDEIRAALKPDRPH